MQSRTKILVNLALLSAIAYVVMLFGRIPVVLFLKYDPKDVVIAIGGFIYGPMASFIVAAVVAFVEMITTSDTGPIGFTMNLLASACFACTAAFIYKRNHSIPGAVTGLVTGGILTTAVMLLWNYLLTPIYMGYPREAIAALLLPAFLPFNLLKVGLNGALAMILYKPVVTALRRSGLVPPSVAPEQGIKKHAGVLLVSAGILVTCILAVLAFNKII